MTPEQREVFDEIRSRLVPSEGLTLKQIAWLVALAEEEVAGRPDSDRAGYCRRSLGLAADWRQDTPEEPETEEQPALDL